MGGVGLTILNSQDFTDFTTYPFQFILQSTCLDCTGRFPSKPRIDRPGTNSYRTPTFSISLIRFNST